MDILNMLFKQNIGTLMFGIFIIICSINVVLKSISDFCAYINLPFGWVKKRDEDHIILQKLVSDYSKKEEAMEKLISTQDTKIELLMSAQKEMMLEKINDKYKHYIAINGIPKDEIDDFISLHNVYKSIGGNHNGDVKFDYCINNLQII